MLPAAPATPREEDGWSKRKVRVAISYLCTHTVAQVDDTEGVNGVNPSDLGSVKAEFFSGVQRRQ